jgi:hypothetical protein
MGKLYCRISLAATEARFEPEEKEVLAANAMGKRPFSLFR